MLADLLVSRGAVCRFLCREHRGHLAQLIERRGHEVVLLPNASRADVPPLADPPHASWLGCSWQEDAEQTQAALDGFGAEWLVVDHYAVDARWQRAVARPGRRTLVIDDLADREHACDVLLDQNLYADAKSRYVGKVPASCTLLLGPRYALLQPGYARLRERIPPREGPVRRVLVFFGAADSRNLTRMALEAFLDLKRMDVTADVVVSSRSPHVESIRALAAGKPNVQLHSDLPSLDGLIASADLAIGAGGSTSWERLCLGLPSLVITLAENQRAIADHLQRAGLAKWLGHQDVVTWEQLRAALLVQIESGVDVSASTRGPEVVDGEGAARAAAIMMASAGSALKARLATLKDEAELVGTSALAGANPWPSSGAFRRDLRGLETVGIVIVELEEGTFAGVARFEKKADRWSFACAAAPAFAHSLPADRVAAIALACLREQFRGALVFEPSGPRSQPLRLTICSDSATWMNVSLPAQVLEWLASGVEVCWCHDAAEAPGGEMCFFLSYERIVPPALLQRFRHNLVVHASDLPKGRGWSPLTWQILEGRNEIVVTLIEAAEPVDSGIIYDQCVMRFDGTELLPELRNTLAKAVLELCANAVRSYPESLGNARAQSGEPSHYPRRRPIDSRLATDRPLAEQFDLLRTVDNDRYPVWFELRGARYTLKIERES